MKMKKNPIVGKSTLARRTKRIEWFERWWLQGSTCYHHPKSAFWTSEDKRFLVMKHHGHSAYTDRFGGTKRCGTRYYLYDLDNDTHINPLGEPYLELWEGRWSKKCQAELERFLSQDWSLLEFDGHKHSDYGIYTNDNWQRPWLLLAFENKVVAFKERLGLPWKTGTGGRIVKPHNSWMFKGWLAPEEVTALKLKGVL